MHIFASIFAGLGLFFIGIRLIGNHLKQLAGPRMRQWIARVVAGRGSVVLFGLAAGAIMQSLNAVTYVLVAMVTAGAIDKRRALPVIHWANIGLSLLVLLASIDLHLLALLLVGLVGLTYYQSLDQSARWRHLVGALLGMGLLFLGVDFIKQGAAVLKGSPWLRDYLVIAEAHPWLGLPIGAVVALVAQSAVTVVVVTMAMAAAGLLGFASGSTLVIGAGLGAAVSALWLSGKLVGSTRQLVHYQVSMRLIGVVLMTLLWLVDSLVGHHTVAGLFELTGLALPARLAAVFLLMQIVSDLGMRLLQKPMLALIERHSPPSVVETLERPHYLHDEALAEPESALLLVEMEQQRLLAALPIYLAPLRDEELSSPSLRASRTADTASARAGKLGVAARRTAEAGVLQQCEQFLGELLDRHNSRTVQDRTMVLRDRIELLAALQESLVELNQAVDLPAAATDTRALCGPLIESLHLMLQTLVDAGRSPDAEDLALLRLLTHDRSEMMDALRRRLQGEAHGPVEQQAVFSASALFERCVWLLRRYVLLLEPGAAEAA